jgi:predicted membrane protein
VSADFNQRRRGRVVFGLFILAVGLFALLDNLHVFDSRLVQPYWPLVFVALGALKLAHRNDTAGIVFGVGLMALGAAMTLNNLDIIAFHVRDWWPLLLIMLGVLSVARGFRPESAIAGCRGRRRHRDERLEHGSRIDTSAMMSALVLKNDSQDFQGGDVSTVMGAVEIDLRQASIVAEAHLHVSVIMGGIEIKVPRDWSVSVNGTPTLGGIEDRSAPPLVSAKRLVIDGSVVMGGVEIVN